jgi:hypothetical protein
MESLAADRSVGVGGPQSRRTLRDVCRGCFDSKAPRVDLTTLAATAVDSLCGPARLARSCELTTAATTVDLRDGGAPRVGTNSNRDGGRDWLGLGLWRWGRHRPEGS